MGRVTKRALTKAAFEELSEFRYQMRRFEQFSENAARAHGVTPRQYLTLLHVKGYPSRNYATVGELAERLQARPNAVVTLISRCEALGLVRRRQGKSDGREIEVHLRADGSRLLTKLAAIHRAELKAIRGIFQIPVVKN